MRNAARLDISDIVRGRCARGRWPLLQHVESACNAAQNGMTPLDWAQQTGNSAVVTVIERIEVGTMRGAPSLRPARRSG